MSSAHLVLSLSPLIHSNHTSKNTEIFSTTEEYVAREKQISQWSEERKKERQKERRKKEGEREREMGTERERVKRTTQNFNHKFIETD